MGHLLLQLQAQFCCVDDLARCVTIPVQSRISYALRLGTSPVPQKGPRSCAAGFHWRLQITLSDTESLLATRKLVSQPARLFFETMELALFGHRVTPNAMRMSHIETVVRPKSPKVSNMLVDANNLEVSGGVYETHSQARTVPSIGRLFQEALRPQTPWLVLSGGRCTSSAGAPRMALVAIAPRIPWQKLVGAPTQRNFRSRKRRQLSLAEHNGSLGYE